MLFYFPYYYYRKREVYRIGSIGMFKLNQIIVLFSFLSWGLTSWDAMAQTTSNVEDNITFSGESLQGIETQSINGSEDYQQKTPKLDVTIEKQKESSDTDVLFEGLVEESNKNEPPIYTIDKINTNSGEGRNSQSGTIPLGSF